MRLDIYTETINIKNMVAERIVYQMNLKKFIIFINSENADMSNVKLRLLRSRRIIQGFLRKG
jgi:hypothetical protein